MSRARILLIGNCYHIFGEIDPELGTMGYVGKRVLPLINGAGPDKRR